MVSTLVKVDPILLPTYTGSNLVALDLWRKQIGLTAATVWRWRRRGWIEVINIAGRLYISREAIARFEQAAAAGEFSQLHKTPSRRGERR